MRTSHGRPDRFMKAHYAVQPVKVTPVPDEHIVQYLHLGTSWRLQRLNVLPALWAESIIVGHQYNRVVVIQIMNRLRGKELIQSWHCGWFVSMPVETKRNLSGDIGNTDFIRHDRDPAAFSNPRRILEMRVEAGAPLQHPIDHPALFHFALQRRNESRLGHHREKILLILRIAFVACPAARNSEKIRRERFFEETSWDDVILRGRWPTAIYAGQRPTHNGRFLAGADPSLAVHFQHEAIRESFRQVPRPAKRSSRAARIPTRPSRASRIPPEA